MRHFVRFLFLAALFGALPLAVASALPPYPEPPPDFSHPGSPHNGDPIYGPVGGNDDRPLLLIYVRFTDVAPAAGRDAAFFAGAMFGPFPSLAGYFNANSFGDFIITPAAESNTTFNGAVNDGVVVVDHGDTWANFTGMTEAAQNRRAVTLADPSVNFASFDANNDGNVTDDELIILMIRTSNPVPMNPDSCGATRGIDPGTTDGKNVAMSIAMGGTDTNLITHIHEIGHSALHMRDLYGFGVGAFDISGPTCGAADTTFFNTSAWQKTHWGWINPTVVVQDGYYLVDRADSNAEAFILYDPSKGTNDYMIVENRQIGAGTYDQTASDSGLVIWRVDDDEYNSGVETVRPIEIMRPDGTATGGCDSSGVCYSGSNIDAWNPSDPSTPQRTMSRTWRDGTASNVAVRAIGPSGNVIRAYFDVRGPGVLIDPTTANGQVLRVDVTPEEANPVAFTVMNTGEAADDFEFTIEGLPAGWSANIDTKNGLGAATGSTANILVTVPADAPVGTVTATAVGRSKTNPAIETRCEIRLRVVLHTTAITYTGATSVPWGQPSGFSAQLSDTTDPTEVVDGATVTFSLNTSPALIATTASNITGAASASPTLPAQPGTYTLTISSARHGKHGPATTTVSYTIEKRATSIAYTGDTTEDYSDPTDVSATLTDTISGAPIPAKTIQFAVGTQGASGATGALGSASAVIVINQPSGVVMASATFAEDALYLGSTATASFTITKETLSLVYTGDTVVGLGTTPTLRSVATEEADGSPGDLSLAQAAFHLEPTLTLTAFDYLAAVSAAGLSSTPAVGLPVDLWTITVAVPASNPYWEGASVAPAELVLYDPAAHITGGGHGPDTAGVRAQPNFTGRYQGTAPKGQVEFRSSAGRFKGSDYDWIVVVAGKTIFQVRGQLGGLPVVLRLRADDLGEPGGGTDTFSARIRDIANATIYQSGTVVLEGGNFQIRP